MKWSELLRDEFHKDYMINLQKHLANLRNHNVPIYPKHEDIFNAFKLTPFENIKVVILGQDCYHGEGQAHGLAFSVKDNMKVPPSLQNIFKELETDIDGYVKPDSGNLTEWAKQGVLLLNSILTVEKAKPSSHQGLGWERFTDHVIKTISDEKDGIVFIFWGSYARSKKKFVNLSKHFVLESPHPSPFSAHNGFFGCKHFSQTNKILEQSKKEPINW